MVSMRKGHKTTRWVISKNEMPKDNEVFVGYVCFDNGKSDFCMARRTDDGILFGVESEDMVGKSMCMPCWLPMPELPEAIKEQIRIAGFKEAKEDNLT